MLLRGSELTKLKCTCQILQVDLLEDKTWDEEMSREIFFLFFHVQLYQIIVPPGILIILQVWLILFRRRHHKRYVLHKVNLVISFLCFSMSKASSIFLWDICFSFDILFSCFFYFSFTSFNSFEVLPSNILRKALCIERNSWFNIAHWALHMWEASVVSSYLPRLCFMLF